MNQQLIGLMLVTTLGLEATTLGEALSQSKVDGYLRGTYQSHDIQNDKVYEDDAIGGKIHFETGAFYGFSMGASAYSSNSVFNDDNKGLVPLRGESYKSYSILGEAYLRSKFGKNTLTLGRQEINTPFAQTDDIGMVPNTFESAVFESTSMENSTFFVAHLEKMAGVDAEVVNAFTKLNGTQGVQVFGATYEGFKDLALEAWYYNINQAEVDSIAFLEADYEKSVNQMTYGFGLQYAKQGYRAGKSANVYGLTLSSTFDALGLTFSGAYTKVEDNAASSGFGGGPFYSNSEYLILDNAGKDGDAKWYGVEYSPTSKMFAGLSIALGKVTLKNEQGLKATEVDLVTSYEINDDMEIHAIFSNLKGANVGEDNAKHVRVFANYNF
jgi:hypothetical protein